jgi:hypothetical protein
MGDGLRTKGSGDTDTPLDVRRGGIGGGTPGAALCVGVGA